MPSLPYCLFCIRCQASCIVSSFVCSLPRMQKCWSMCCSVFAVCWQRTATHYITHCNTLLPLTTTTFFLSLSALSLAFLISLSISFSCANARFLRFTLSHLRAISSPLLSLTRHFSAGPVLVSRGSETLSSLSHRYGSSPSSIRKVCCSVCSVCVAVCVAVRCRSCRDSVLPLAPLWCVTLVHTKGVLQHVL